MEVKGQLTTPRLKTKIAILLHFPCYGMDVMALVEDFDQEYPTLVLKSGQPSSFPPIPALSASDWQNTGKLEVLGFKYVQTMTVQ